VDSFFTINGFITHDPELAHEYLAENKPIHVDIVNYQDLGTVTSSSKIEQNLVIIPIINLP
jgi:hypothetical protein